MKDIKKELEKKLFPKNDEYFERCEDIRHELDRGFFAIQILHAFECYEDDEFDDDDDRYMLMFYLLQMSKMDVAMVICKVFDLKEPYYDSRRGNLIESNTIKNLTTFLNNNGYSFGKPMLTSESFALYLELKEIRNKFLAHLDVNRDLGETSIAKMMACFDEIVVLYNARCIKELDYRVNKYEMDEYSQLPERVKHGIQLILDEFKIENKEGDEDAGH